MNIQEFTFQKFLESVEDNPSLKRKYYSTIYKQHFSLRPWNLMAKLVPIRKEDAKCLIPDFHRRVNTNQRFSNYKGNYLFEPNEYFLFRYKIPMQTENLHIRFRTKSDDKLVDDFLEFLQESTNIRFCCIPDGLDKKIESFRDVYEKSIDENGLLVDDPQEQLVYVAKGRRKSWIGETITSILDTMHLMEESKYNLREVIDKVSKIEIRHDKEESSLIWNTTFNILRSKY